MTFYFKAFFPKDLLITKIKPLFFENFFSENFFGGGHIYTLYIVLATHMSQIFYYGLITKNRKIGDKVQRISQKHPEKHSIEILRNFCRKNSWEILRNFSRLCQFPQKFCEIGDQVLRNSQEFPEKFSEEFSYPLKISENGDQFQRISQEFLTNLFSRNSSETP